MRHDRNWGGKRTGAGRQRNVAKLGRPKEGVKNIHDFFGNTRAKATMGNFNSVPARRRQEDAPPEDEDSDNEGEFPPPPEIDEVPPEIAVSPATSQQQAQEGHHLAGFQVQHHSNEATPARKPAKLSGILSDMISSINQKKAEENVVHGELWSRTTTAFVPQSKVPQKSLQQCWKMFYGYNIFTWRPDLMMPGWKPSCVTCGQQGGIGVHATSREPRLVYGITRNYIFKSPIQWACKVCKATHAKEAARGLPSSERSQYCFSSHHHRVLEEIGREHPGIRSIFPCYLGWKSGLDNELISLLFAAADSGMGPSAVAEFVSVSHLHCHQQCELRWLQFLSFRRKQPLPLDVRATIQHLAFPSYDSDEICGKVPSQSLLCDMYCEITRSNNHRMDSIHQRRVRTSKLFCMDASYKVPKWLASMHGEAMYSTLITAVNEYGETLSSYFALSDNHKEIASCLSLLKECGFAPELGYVDNVPRDGPFLEECLPTLCSSREETGERNNDEANLPLLGLRDSPLYLPRGEDAIAAIDLFEEAVLDTPGTPVISFDLEWSISAEGIPSQTSVIAFGSLAYPSVLVVHLARIRQHIRELLARIRSLLANERIVYVGSNIRNDVTKLQRDFPSANIVVPSSINLGMMAVYRGVVRFKKGEYTLRALARSVLAMELPKDPEIRVSNLWNREGPLRQEATEYVSRDIESAVLIYDKLKELPDLSIRLKKTEIQVGMEVDVMASRKTVISPIASGTVVQVGGTTLAGINLSGRRVLLEIEEVYKPESAMRFTQAGRHKCKCGRIIHKPSHTAQCDLRTYRDAQRWNPSDPFVVVEECDNMRKHVPHGSSVGLSASASDTTTRTTRVLQPAMEPIRQDATADRNDDRDDGVCHQQRLENDLGDPAFVEDEEPNLEVDQLEALDSIVQLDADHEEPSGHGSESEEKDTTPHPICDPLANANPSQVAIESNTRNIVAAFIEEADRIGKEEVEGERSCHLAVLGDPFHIMDRVRVPVHHDWKAAYFSALRDAIFIFDSDKDKENVVRVLRCKGKSWDETLSHNFSYLALRVRRRIPSPRILHARIKAVYDFFADKQDSRTGLPLFGERARKTATLVLQAINRGELSDPPNFSLYVPLFNSDGTEKHDKDGLRLWRCLRGTGPAEKAHAQYTRSFGQVRAGPLYSIAVLRNHHHRKSLRASIIPQSSSL